MAPGQGIPPSCREDELKRISRPPPPGTCARWPGQRLKLDRLHRLRSTGSQMTDPHAVRRRLTISGESGRCPSSTACGRSAIRRSASREAASGEDVVREDPCARWIPRADRAEARANALGGCRTSSRLRLLGETTPSDRRRRHVPAVQGRPGSGRGLQDTLRRRSGCQPRLGAYTVAVAHRRATHGDALCSWVATEVEEFSSRMGSEAHESASGQ